MERMQKEREEGVDVDAKYGCSRKQADYDLIPKRNKSGYELTNMDSASAL